MSMGTDFKYNLSFRIWHPRLTVADISKRFGARPKWFWNRGEPRVGLGGYPMRGVRKETYCCFNIGNGLGLSPDELVAQHLRTLAPHRRFLGAAFRAGGKLDYFLGCWGRNAGIEFPPTLLVELGKMNIVLGIEFYSVEPRTNSSRHP
jgi:hypothetical protein